MFDYQYAYLVGNLFVALPVWLVLFFRRNDLRHEILIVSFFVGLAGPISEFWYTRDYWRPETFIGWAIGVEDFLFGFFIGGIGSVLYEEVFGKHHARRTNRQHHWSWFLIPVVALFLFSFNLFFFLGINSIYASILTFFIISGFMIYFRHDLFIDSLMSGFLVGAFMFFAYLVFLSIFPEAIHRWWLLNNISGILILGIPIEELLWAFGWGMVAGPMYEFFTGLKFRKKN